MKAQLTTDNLIITYTDINLYKQQITLPYQLNTTTNLLNFAITEECLLDLVAIINK